LVFFFSFSFFFVHFNDKFFQKEISTMNKKSPENCKIMNTKFGRKGLSKLA